MIKVALLHFCFAEYSVALANALADYADVTLIHPEKLSSLCRTVADPRICIQTFPKARSRNPANISSMISMMKIIKNINPDVLHVQETFDYWYDLTLLFNRMPPLVTTIHDVLRHPGDRATTFGTEYTKRISFYKSQQLIVHARLLKQALTKQFYVPDNKVNVLPHGEIGSIYQSLAGNSRANREPHTLLFFGRIWPYKGLKYLLKAIPLVAEQIPQVKLIIAGQGEKLQKYFPEGYESERYEIWNEFIPAEAVAGLFQRSTITVLPYIESSQSGVVAIAYAIGTLVIASNVGGLSEMIRHEQDGLLVSPRDVTALANSIIRLLSDSNLQDKLRRNALARCQEDLNWAKIAAETVKIYQKAIDSKSKVKL